MVAGKVVAHTAKAGVTFAMLDQPGILAFPEREVLCPPEFNFSTLQGHLAQQIRVYAQVEPDQGVGEDGNRWGSLNMVELPLTASLNSTSNLDNPVELNALLPSVLNHLPLPSGSAHSEAPPGDLPLPDQLVACHQVALAFWKAGDYEEAQKLYASLIRARPDLAIGLLYCNFGSGALSLLDGINDPDNAAFVVAVNLQPSLWKNYLNLSWEYYLEGNYQKAIHHLTRLLELRPGNTIPAIFYTPEDTALLYKLRAISFLQLKKYLAAAQDATAALKYVASDAVVYEIRGHAGLLMGQWMRSKADFDAAIWMGADSSDSALFSRGLVQLHLGSLANAGQDFGRAFQLNLPHQLAAGFMEQWCNYCLDHKTRGRRLTLGTNKTAKDDTAGFKSTFTPAHWTTQGNGATTNPNITNTLSPFRTQVAMTTSSRSIMAERLQKIATPPHHVSSYWSILGEVVLEYLRNDFPMALATLNRLEKLYNASERPGIAGWSYFYWLGLINLASGQRHRATVYLDRALALGLPPVLLLDGMPLN